MAEKKRRIIKKPETVRQQASKPKVEKKPRRIQRTATSIGRPLKAALHFGRKEYYLPMPDNRVGRFLNKKRRLTPRYFRDAWAELKQVVWPGRRETMKLSIAVFIFAIVFGTLVWVLDYGLDQLFRKVLF